jgi:thymidylate synthase ThyX
MILQEIINGTYATYLLGAQPIVTLLYATPEWIVAQATKGYTGHYAAEALSAEEVKEFWNELGATKLKEPLAMAQAFFLIQDVTRAFTHQIARYRLGINIVQESQRFSLQDKHKATIVIPQNYCKNNTLVEEFIDICEQNMAHYHAAIDAGLAVQDARAILPTHICTRLYVNASILTLAHIYEQRSCCQAQEGEWEEVISQIKCALRQQGFTQYSNVLRAPWETKTCISCGFGASFDRPCAYQSKFEQNLHKINAEKGKKRIEQEAEWKEESV